MTRGHPSPFARTLPLREEGNLGADRAILGSELGTLRACQGLCARLAVAQAIWYLAGSRQEVQLNVGIGQAIGVHGLQSL